MVRNVNSNGEQQDKEVVDEEGSVDKKIKTWIIDTRKRVNKSEQALFVESATDPNIKISRPEQVMTWGTIVKQYLRTIEPILRDDEVTEAQEYYRDIEIGTEVLVPPDTGGYQFSMIPRMMQSREANEVRKALGLPRGVDLPQPEEFTFTGLKSVIEAPDVLEHQWMVKVDAAGAPPNHDHVYPKAEKVLSKDIFVNAVRHADRFLQNAGIGLNLEQGDTPIIRGFDQSGDSDEANIDKTEYRGDPEI